MISLEKSVHGLRAHWRRRNALGHLCLALVGSSSFALAQPASASDAGIVCGDAFGQNGDLLPGLPLTMQFSTARSATGHVGTREVLVDVGNVAVRDGHVDPGLSGGMFKTYLARPPASPTPCVRSIALSLNPNGLPPAGNAVCADGIVTMTLDGEARQNVRAMDGHVPRNVE